MVNFKRLLCLIALSGIFSYPVASRPLSEGAVPEPLKPWVDWVLWAHPQRNCPLPQGSVERRCVWPTRLALQLTDQGGRFSHWVRLYREARISLPGDHHHWPQDVTVDAQAVSLVASQQTPGVRLEPGRYLIEGSFHWRRLPDTLSIPPGIGLVSLTVNGEARPYPRLEDGRLWLRETAPTTERTPEDRLQLEVFRRVIDDHPIWLVTLIRMHVAGEAREAELGRPLPAGFLPIELRSPLPARLLDGRLRVQIRPGEWTLEIHALNPDYVTELTLTERPAPWPHQEIWSFEARPALRLVRLEGGDQIEPRQTRLPTHWHSLPAYRMPAGQTLRFEVVTRGNPQPEPNQLRLQRDLWLDFDGRGFTLRDRIHGRMTSGWRLAVTPELDLGRVTLNGEPSFITRLQSDGSEGVEVRRGDLELVAESRLDGALANLPANGWEQELQQLETVLHLPPGWRLLAASGMDRERHSWLMQWSLYDLFLVFVIAAAAGKLWGWRWGLPSLLALALIWQEPGAPRHIWLYLLAFSALLRVVPEGRIRRVIRLARLLGLLVLAAIALPFMVEQARNGLYPQLASATSYQPPDRALEHGTRLHRSKTLSAAAPRGPMQDALQSELAATDAELAHTPPAELAEARPSDPAMVISTGPGLPAWQWQSIPLSWNGPVSQAQRVHLLLADPTQNLLLTLLRILLLAGLIGRFVALRGLRVGDTTALPLVLLPGLVAMGAPEPAWAAYPPPQLLEQLERRLLQAPACRPECADIQRLLLDLTQTRLSARLTVHSLARTAIPLPLDPRQQTPLQVWLDGEPQAEVARDENGLLWVVVEPGRHQLLLGAALPAEPQLQLPLPLKPHRVEVATVHWAVEGLDENGVPERQLNLTRKSTESVSGETAALVGDTLSSFVRVERKLHFDLEWSVETRVIRLSPVGAPIALRIPLLAGESVLSEDLQVDDDAVLVSMEAGTTHIGWRSRLPQREQVLLSAPPTSRWLERWEADISPHWHVEIEGLAPLHHQGRERWLPSWAPWPGEQVRLHLSRPQGVAGTTRTLEYSRVNLRPGSRATDVELALRLRSSQGGRHEIRLPASSRLLSVSVDGQTQPLRLEGETLSLPLHPGLQSYRLAWHLPDGMQAQWRTPPVDLGLAGVNAEIQVQMPQDRWILFTTGPRLGPAVLFWGQLLIILLAALVLGRLRAYSPLGTVAWLLLGIGLSQVSIWSALLVAATFFAFGYRGRLDPLEHGRSLDLLQIVLVTLSLFTLAILLWAVQQGLLGLPRMQIGGNGSSAYQLNWYQDRSDHRLPEAKVYSVPLWSYRLLMLAWALWLAFSLLGWIGWAWRAFSHGGRWVPLGWRLPTRKRPAAPPEEP